MKGLAADFEEPRGFGDIASGLIERLGDERLFQVRRDGADLVLESLLGAKAGFVYHRGRIPLCGLRQIRRQVGNLDFLVVAKQRAPFDDVFELSDVSRPFVFHEGPHRVRLDAEHFLAEPRVVFFEKMRDEQRNVLLSFPQGRQMNVNNVQSIEEVLSKQSLLNSRSQILIGGGHEPHLHLGGGDAAHPFELAFLDGAEQLDLHFEGDLADFIEEEPVKAPFS